MTRNLAVGLLGSALLAMQGCADAAQPEPASTTPGVDESAPIDTQLLDTIEAGEGASITIEEGPNGALVVVAEAPDTISPELMARLDSAESVEAIYAVFRPGQQIPASVSKALDAYDDGGTFAAVDHDDVPGVDFDEVGTEPSVDELAVQDKEAPRNVSWFKSNFCNRERMDEDKVRNTWWHRNNYCRTEYTNGFNLYFYGVRQGYANAYMYRGNANLRYYWRTGSSWNYGASYSVSEGHYRSVRVTTSSEMDLRFQLYNASGDGFNYAIQTADANALGMKSGGNGSDRYDVFCLCVDAAGSAAVTLDQCLTNPKSSNDDSNTKDGAAFKCIGLAGVLTNLNGLNTTCALTSARRATTGENCSTNFEPINVCSDEGEMCSR